MSDIATIPSVKSGDYWGGMSLTFETSTDGTTYTPINIAGYTISIDWKAKKGGDIVLTMSTTNGKISITDAVGGVASVLPITEIELPEGLYLGNIYYSNGGAKTTYGQIEWEIE